jgi:hypothetical protein
LEKQEAILGIVANFFGKIEIDFLWVESQLMRKRARFDSKQKIGFFGMKV